MIQRKQKGNASQSSKTVLSPTGKEECLLQKHRHARVSETKEQNKTSDLLFLEWPPENGERRMIRKKMYNTHIDAAMEKGCFF